LALTLVFSVFPGLRPLPRVNPPRDFNMRNYMFMRGAGDNTGGAGGNTG